MCVSRQLLLYYLRMQSLLLSHTHTHSLQRATGAPLPAPTPASLLPISPRASWATSRSTPPSTTHTHTRTVGIHTHTCIYIYILCARPLIFVCFLSLALSCNHIKLTDYSGMGPSAGGHSVLLGGGSRGARQSQDSMHMLRTISVCGIDVR
jgi:hypothetical protein